MRPKKQEKTKEEKLKTSKSTLKEDSYKKNGKHSKKRKQTDENSTEEPLTKRDKKDSLLCKQSNGEEVEDPEVIKEGDMSLFRISDEIADGLKERGITYLFPIQSKTFDYIYDGKDVIGQARTGTGKTLSFALPLVERLQLEQTRMRGRPPQVLVMAPTRELAKQVGAEFEILARDLSVFCIYGGMPYDPQEYAIRSGLDVLVGTPGRILDHLKRGTLDLSQLKHVVLDEVDRMLDMGFAESVEEILAASYSSDREHKPQTLLFSATLPPWVEKTAKKYMSTDRHVIDLIGQDVLKASETVQHMAIKCSYHARASAIRDVVQVYGGSHGRTIVFTETKRDANDLALTSVLKQDTQVLHGDIPQNTRELTLKGFRDGKFRCLVATDVAARGLDIQEVDLVVQCEPPKDVDGYIHRSGRTGRAGRQGLCVVFYKPDQEFQLVACERRAGIKFKRIGVPQTADIIKASGHDAVRFLEQVPPETLLHFRDMAEKFVEDKGAVDAVAAALAHISGTTEIKNRSLLSAQEGFTTYTMKCPDVELRGTGYMWNIIEQKLDGLKPEVLGMRICKDKRGVVFDVPSGWEKKIASIWEDSRGVTLEVATELPELLERRDFTGGERRDSYGGNHRGRNNGGFQRGNRTTWQDKPFKRKDGFGKDQWRSNDDFNFNKKSYQ